MSIDAFKLKKSGIAFGICIAVLFVLQCLPFFTAPKKPLLLEQSRPKVPTDYIVVEKPEERFQNQLFQHPWLKKQPEIKEISAEIVKDLENANTLWISIEKEQKDSSQSAFSQKTFDQLLVDKLSALQQQIPFKLPKDKYSVLCIPDALKLYPDAPFPFQIYQRLYLGDTFLGLPIYLDVRVFELQNKKNEIEEIKKWHFDVLSEGFANFTVLKEGYIGKGFKNSKFPDPSHGLNYREERGIYINFLVLNNKLYVLYLETSLESIQKIFFS